MDGGLADLAEPARQRLVAHHQARERSYGESREVIRAAANAIRAVHRGEVERADELLALAAQRLEAAAEAARPFPAVFHGGFLQDAMKEFAEARITRAVLAGAPPEPADELGVDDAAWFHGLAETVGEARRACLDHVRAGRIERAELLLDVMQEILGVLVTVDVPDALTRGLRRATDGARAITERTRGDLTAAIGQRQLREALDAHRSALERAMASPEART